jgi:hypothetical protein
MNTIAHAHPAPYCRLPSHDSRRGYVRAEHTNIAETFRQFAPIFVSAVQPVHARQDFDDYTMAERT